MPIVILEVSLCFRSVLYGFVTFMLYKFSAIYEGGTSVILPLYHGGGMQNNRDMMCDNL